MAEMWRIRVLFDRPVVKLNASDVVVNGGEIQDIVSHVQGSFEVIGILHSTAKMISASLKPLRNQLCSSGFESSTLSTRLQSGGITASADDCPPIVCCFCRYQNNSN